MPLRRRRPAPPTLNSTMEEMGITRPPVSPFVLALQEQILAGLDEGQTVASLPLPEITSRVEKALTDLADQSESYLAKRRSESEITVDSACAEINFALADAVLSDLSGLGAREGSYKRAGAEFAATNPGAANTITSKDIDVINARNGWYAFGEFLAAHTGISEEEWRASQLEPDGNRDSVLRQIDEADLAWSQLFAEKPEVLDSLSREFFFQSSVMYPPWSSAREMPDFPDRKATMQILLGRIAVARIRSAISEGVRTVVAPVVEARIAERLEKERIKEQMRIAQESDILRTEWEELSSPKPTIDDLSASS